MSPGISLMKFTKHNIFHILLVIAAGACLPASGQAPLLKMNYKMNNMLVSDIDPAKKQAPKLYMTMTISQKSNSSTWPLTRFGGMSGQVHLAHAGASTIAFDSRETQTGIDPSREGPGMIPSERIRIYAASLEQLQPAADLKIDLDLKLDLTYTSLHTRRTLDGILMMAHSLHLDLDQAIGLLNQLASKGIQILCVPLKDSVKATDPVDIRILPVRS